MPAQPGDIAAAPQGRPGWLARLRGRVLGRGAFGRNVSVMLAGSLLGQMTSVLLAPVLTRLFTPQQFGVLSVYTALLTILIVMSSLRYEMTIPMADTDEDALNLAALCALVLLGTTGAVAAAALLAPEAWLDALWLLPLSPYRVLLPVGFAGLGAYFIALYVATRAGAFPAIARTRVMQGVLGPLSQIGLGLLGAGTPGLVLGYVLGQSSGAVGLARQVVARAGLGAVRLPRMLALGRRYRRFPLIASWAALIDAAGGQVLYLLVTAQYSAGIAGFVFLSERIVARPLMMLGTSLLQVYVGEAGRTATADPAALERRFRQVVTRQFLVALGWVVAANLGAALLFPLVFGAAWAGGVAYVQALSVAYLAQAVVQPVFHTLQILQRQALAAAWQAGRLAAVVLAFTLAARAGAAAPVAVLWYAVAQAGCCLVLLALMAGAIRSNRA